MSLYISYNDGTDKLEVNKYRKMCGILFLLLLLNERTCTLYYFNVHCGYTFIKGFIRR